MLQFRSTRVSGVLAGTMCLLVGLAFAVLASFCTPAQAYASEVVMSGDQSSGGSSSTGQNTLVVDNLPAYATSDMPAWIAPYLLSSDGHIIEHDITTCGVSPTSSQLNMNMCTRNGFTKYVHGDMYNNTVAGGPNSLILTQENNVTRKGDNPDFTKFMYKAQRSDWGALVLEFDELEQGLNEQTAVVRYPLVGHARDVSSGEISWIGADVTYKVTSLASNASRSAAAYLQDTTVLQLAKSFYSGVVQQNVDHLDVEVRFFYYEDLSSDTSTENVSYIPIPENSWFTLGSLTDEGFSVNADSDSVISYLDDGGVDTCTFTKPNGEKGTFILGTRDKEDRPSSSWNYLDETYEDYVSGSNFQKLAATCSQGYSDAFKFTTWVPSNFFSSGYTISKSVSASFTKNEGTNWWSFLSASLQEVAPYVSKSASVETVDVGYSFAYYIDCTMPVAGVEMLGRYSKLVIEDTLPNNVSYSSARLYLRKAGSSSEVDITEEAGKVSSTGKKLTYTFSSDYLDNELLMEGETLRLKISVHVGEDAYDSILTNKAYVTTSETKTQTNEVEITVPAQTATIVKTDEDGNPLSGADLQITDIDGNVVASWTTDGTPYTWEIPGVDEYFLEEVSPPKGYEAADSILFYYGSLNLDITMIDKKTAAPHLQLEKSADPISGESVYPGDTITYTLCVTNDGDAEASDCVIQDCIPDGCSFVSAESAESTFSDTSGSLTWREITLNPGEEYTVSFAVRVTSFAKNSITNTFYADFDWDGVSAPSFVSNEVTHQVATIVPTEARTKGGDALFVLACGCIACVLSGLWLFKKTRIY